MASVIVSSDDDATDLSSEGSVGRQAVKSRTKAIPLKREECLITLTLPGKEWSAIIASMKAATLT